jgi:hypothetical protein
MNRESFNQNMDSNPNHIIHYILEEDCYREDIFIYMWHEDIYMEHEDSYSDHKNIYMLHGNIYMEHDDSYRDHDGCYS